VTEGMKSVFELQMIALRLDSLQIKSVYRTLGCALIFLRGAVTIVHGLSVHEKACCSPSGRASLQNGGRFINL